jgi:hypothetical protein
MHNILIVLQVLAFLWVVPMTFLGIIWHNEKPLDWELIQVVWIALAVLHYLGS